MDDFEHRYDDLVWRLNQRDDLAGLAVAAVQLAADARSTTLRTLARSIAASARALLGEPADVEAIVDASVPSAQGDPTAALDGLLPGDAPLAERLAAHRRATRLDAEGVAVAAERLVLALRHRAREDLDLPDGEEVEVETVSAHDESWHARSVADGPRTRLVLNVAAAWTAERLLRTVTGETYPGRHLTRVMRPPTRTFAPSPLETVDRGLAAVGGEVLLADHELGYELTRAARSAGHARPGWNGDLVVAVCRAIDERRPAVAAAAVSADAQLVPRLLALGMTPEGASGLLERWRDPLERAASVAWAAGPPLVRAWLAAVGQTGGLHRLLSEWLVPSRLREELDDGAR